MSLNLDKWKEHEAAAQKALRQKDYRKAFWHTAKMAEYSLNLAERSDGSVAKAYLKEANELIDLAGSMKGKAAEQKNVKRMEDGEETSRGEESSRSEGSSFYELMEKPNVRLEDVIGLEDAKKVITERVINPFKYPDVYKRFNMDAGESVLLYGPPGTGKSYFASAIASELDAAFFLVDMSAIKNKYYGETEKNIHALFEQARKKERAVVFLDEVDSILEKRGGRKVNAVNQFLVELDGLVKNKKGMMLILAATNRPWDIDEAILRSGRFNEKIHVGLPDAQAREQILRLYLQDAPADEGLDYALYAGRTDGYSGGDLFLVCKKAKQNAVNRQLQSGEDECVGGGDLDEALAKIKPTDNPDTVRRLKEWSQAGTPRSE